MVANGYHRIGISATVFVYFAMGLQPLLQRGKTGIRPPIRLCNSITGRTIGSDEL